MYIFKLYVHIIKRKGRSIVRINKLFSNYGICSRKDTNKLISEGRVTVDGEKCCLGQWVTEDSVIKLDGKRIEKKERIYLAFNKPKNVICTKDHDVKDNIIDYINYNTYIFPVGRLDKDSEGLILLTNDGDFSDNIINGSSHYEKEYIVRVDKKIDEDFIDNIKKGVILSHKGKTKIRRLSDKDGFIEKIENNKKIRIEDTLENLKKIVSKDEIIKTLPCSAYKISDYEFSIILKQGLNRQIRRMCAAFSYNVTFLKRIRIDNIYLDGLETGQLRKLNQNEFRGISMKNETEFIFAERGTDYFNQGLDMAFAEFFEKHNHPREMMNDKYEDNAHHIVAVFNNKVIGHARFTRVDENWAKISQVVVDENYRGMKIGFKLINKLMSEAEKLNLAYVELDARTYAVNFYMKNGFITIGEEFISKKTGYPLIKMVRKWKYDTEVTVDKL